MRIGISTRWHKYDDACAADPVNKVRRVVEAGLALPEEGAASGAPTFVTAGGGASTCLGTSPQLRHSVLRDFLSHRRSVPSIHIPSRLDSIVKCRAAGKS